MPQAFGAQPRHEAGGSVVLRIGIRDRLEELRDTLAEPERLAREDEPAQVVHELVRDHFRFQAQRGRVEHDGRLKEPVHHEVPDGGVRRDGEVRALFGGDYHAKTPGQLQVLSADGADHRPFQRLQLVHERCGIGPVQIREHIEMPASVFVPLGAAVGGTFECTRQHAGAGADGEQGDEGSELPKGHSIFYRHHPACSN